MNVHVDVTGFYDWAPCPPGTEITEDDVRTLRVKQMSDGSWQMRVEITTDTHHDVRIPEPAIVDRMLSLELLGRTQSRDATVAEILTSSFRHHIPVKCITEITVTDDGPDEALYLAELARLEVPEAKAAAALASYMDESDIEAYLNVVFKAKKFKKTKEPK